ncbi:hypothetical protein AOX55_00004889 (plasmid) [Sinorhizobium fredii CCBAU 25509]|nr:hypothetical protein AOX55_00004889 [Sinorhizobium fredii CCBAU 25509]
MHAATKAFFADFLSSEWRNAASLNCSSLLHYIARPLVLQEIQGIVAELARHTVLQRHPRDRATNTCALPKANHQEPSTA